MLYSFWRLCIAAIAACMVIAVCFSPAGAEDGGSTRSDSSIARSSPDSTPSEKPMFELDRMVVTASKRAMNADVVVENVKIITAEDVKNSGVFNAMQLLDGLPGVDVDPGRTQTNIVLNGMTGPYVKILMDGVPVTGDVGGGFPLENLVMGDVDRIEVMTGASSTMYGTDAVGGVVNFISGRPGNTTPLRLRASYSYLNNDSVADWGGKNRLDISAAHVNSFLSAQGFYGFDLDNGTYDYSRDGRFVRKLYTYPGSDRQKAGLRLAIYPTESLILRPSASYTTSATTRNYADGHISFLENRYRTINLSGSFQPTKQASVDGYGKAADFKHVYRKIHQGVTEGTTDDKITNFRDYEGELRASFDELLPFGGTNSVLAGVNALNEEIESDNLRKGAERTQVAAFASGHWESGTPVQVIVNPSVRIAGYVLSDEQRTEQDISDICPKLGARVNFPFAHSQLLFVTAAYGHAYQVPRLKNMYYSFNMGSSMWIEGNERLKPEVSNQFNGGVGYRFGPALELSIESFYNSLTNMIVLHSVLDESGSAVFIDGLPLHSYVNADEGYAWGVSPGVSFSPALWMSVSCNVSIVRSFAQNKNGIMREKENYTPNALALKIHAPLEKIRGFLPSVSAGVFWKDEQITGYDTAGDPLYNDSFTKVNVQLSKAILSGVTLRLGANNLLDYTRPGHDGIEYGRTYTASIDMNIDNIMKIGESLHPKLF